MTKKGIPNPSRVLLGVVLGAHGLNGEVKVKTFTESPESLRAYGALNSGDGRELVVAGLRSPNGDEVLVRFAGIASREAAESLKRQELWIARDAFPEPESGEYYEADLIGLKAEDREGNALGQVCALHNFGAGTVMEIETAKGSEFIAFTDESVPVVDIAGGRIVVVFPRENDS